MAPEQADGHSVSYRSDLYSLGGVLYALLARRPPLRGKTLLETLDMQRHVVPEPIRNFVPDAPIELEEIIAQLLAKQPEQRVPNAQVLLRRLDAMNERRRTLAARYDAGLAGLPLALPVERTGARHVYHLYVVRTPRRQELAAHLRARGIQTGIHYPVPTHRQPAVERFAPPALPATERLVDEILTLPLSAGHTDAEIDAVVDAVRSFFGA